MRPLASKQSDQVKTLGERKLIASISQWLGDLSPPAPRGIGDDAAVLEVREGKLIATKDALVLDKHFSSDASASMVGAKLLKRNLSDLAAMGARPQAALIACMLPPQTSVQWLESFYRGLAESAHTFQSPIVGGDVTATKKDLAFTLTLLGICNGNPLTRKTANPGDTLWVSGTLGGSQAGKHLEFLPRIKEGQWLAFHGKITSAMDVSDGLATDLEHLCPDEATIEVDTDSIPISNSAQQLSKNSGKTAFQHAMCDGEDYELLFTLDYRAEPEPFIAEWRQFFELPITCIGKIGTHTGNKNNPIIYRGSYQDFEGQGHGHF